MIRRIAGILLRPRATFTQLAAQPVWLDTWLVILVAWAACGVSLLITDIGQQALVDERVRVIETFGGTVSDAEYARLIAAPPWWVYFTSGGRLLLLPPVTLLVACALWLVTRVERAPATFSRALAIAVHATVVLAVGQIVATPMHFIRESLTSPLNFAGVLPLMEEGTLPARFFGTLDLFAVWWAGLLALGASVFTGHRLSRYAMPLAAVYFGFAAVVAVLVAVMGGS